MNEGDEKQDFHCANTSVSQSEDSGSSRKPSSHRRIVSKTCVSFLATLPSYNKAQGMSDWRHLVLLTLISAPGLALFLFSLPLLLKLLLTN